MKTEIATTLRKLFLFLSKKEKEKQRFNKQEILMATGWKDSTFQTYLSKGQLSDFINLVDKDLFEASNCQGISDIEFSKRLSQSKYKRELGHNCKSKLAKALLKKSKDNMMFALESYNRLSIENRLDAFVMCFCTAWEQLLKAKIIEDDGEESIFIKDKKQGLKKTISLRKCLGKLFEEKSKIRKNIEDIVTLRDQATHILMPEIQCVVSRIFQSGIFNYSSYFKQFTEIPFLSNKNMGIASLVGEFKIPPILMFNSIYGEIGNDISKLAISLEDEINKNDNIEYALPLNVKLGLAVSDYDGNFVKLVKADGDIEALKKALIIEKHVDRIKTHPYLQKDAIKEINKELVNRYAREKIEKHLVAKDKSTSKKVINKNCFDAVVYKNKWKINNDKYHYKNTNPELHYYSLELIEEFIKKIMENEDYLYNAKKEYYKNKKIRNKKLKI